MVMWCGADDYTADSAVFGNQKPKILSPLPPVKTMFFSSSSLILFGPVVHQAHMSHPNCVPPERSLPLGKPLQTIITAHHASISDWTRNHSWNQLSAYQIRMTYMDALNSNLCHRPVVADLRLEDENQMHNYTLQSKVIGVSMNEAGSNCTVAFRDWFFFIFYKKHFIYPLSICLLAK